MAMHPANDIESVPQGANGRMPRGMQATRHGKPGQRGPERIR